MLKMKSIPSILTANKFSLVPLMGTILVPFLICSAANADTITIDLQNHTLTYEDKILDIHETFPIVAPSYDGLKRYEGRTKFRISLINTFPNWTNPRTGKRYPGGHPLNPLGNTRIRFIDKSKGLRPCSIHGAARISDLGRNLSNCCIRLLNKDARRLRFMITYDTKVLIRY